MSQTGISRDEFTMPDGRELPALRVETEGWELVEYLWEIDSVMRDVSWGTFGDNHKDWYNAWTKECFRVRRALGVFDPWLY